jgi:hypothetical protein
MELLLELTPAIKASCFMSDLMALLAGFDMLVAYMSRLANIGFNLKRQTNSFKTVI